MLESIPALGIGTWNMGDARKTRADEIAALQLAVDLGMRVVDTAEMYGDGAAEALVAEALAHRRDEVFLVSKVLPQHATRRGTIAACDASLRRLKTDRLDLYLLHWRGSVPLAETLDGFARLERDGKIRRWGVSNFDTDDMEELVALDGGTRVGANQVLYNLSRRGIEYDLLPWCRAHGVRVMAYSPLEQGRLVARKALHAVAARLGATPAQVALAWVLRQPGVIAIPKSGRPERVRENRAALDIERGARRSRGAGRGLPAAGTEKSARNDLSSTGIIRTRMMIKNAVYRTVALSLLVTLLAAGGARAQTATYEPTPGQAGKDVVWVPTPQELVDKMLDMAKVTPQDIVMDLGSGDGRNVIAAAKRGARAFGFEFNPDMVALARRKAQEAGVAHLATFVEGDMYEADISKATVLALFLLPSNLDKLAPKFLALRPGTRMVNNTFQVTGWEPDASETVEGSCTSWCTSHLNIIPAKAAGTWRLGSTDLTLTQEFQIVSGTLGTTAISAGRLNGEQISFTVGDTQYHGKVSGDRMEGTATAGGNTQSWTATKANGN